MLDKASILKSDMQVGDPLFRSRYKNCDCNDGCAKVLKKVLKSNPHRSDIREYLKSIK